VGSVSRNRRSLSGPGVASWLLQSRERPGTPNGRQSLTPHSVSRDWPLRSLCRNPVQESEHRERQGNSRNVLARDLPAGVARVSMRAAATEANSSSSERPLVAEQRKVGVGGSFLASPDPGSLQAYRTNGIGHQRGQGRFPPLGTRAGVPLQTERRPPRHRGSRASERALFTDGKSAALTGGLTLCLRRVTPEAVWHPT
jgi:hypothetical protein